MFNSLMHRLVGRPARPCRAWLAARRVTANAVTLSGLAIGLLVLPCLAYRQYEAALVIIIVNRLFDGLDGAIARKAGPTAFGGYLDIFCDAVFYAAVPLGFALADPRYAVWSALLLATFVCTMTSFLGRAVVAAQRGEAMGAGAGGSVLLCRRHHRRHRNHRGLRRVLLVPGGFPAARRDFRCLVPVDGLARLVECARSEGFHSGNRRGVANSEGRQMAQQRKLLVWQ